MNISTDLNIINLEKTHCKRGHIAQCLADKNMHEAPHFEYFGKRVQRGTVVLHTKNGDFALKFRCENGWLASAEIM